MEKLAGNAVAGDTFSDGRRPEFDQDCLCNALLFRELELLRGQVALLRTLGLKLARTGGSRDGLGAIAEALLEELGVVRVAIFSLQEEKLVLCLLAGRGEGSRYFAAGPRVSLEARCVREMAERGEVTITYGRGAHGFARLGPAASDGRMLLLALTAGGGLVGAVGMTAGRHELTARQRRLLVLARPMLAAAVRSALIRLGLAPTEKKDGQREGFAEQESLELEWGMLAGSSPAFARLLKKIKALGCRHSPVLIQGPAGTEKVLVAKAIHLGSLFKDGPFLLVSSRSLGGSDGSPDHLKAWLGRACGGTLVVSGVENLPSATRSAFAEAFSAGLIAGEKESDKVEDRVRLVATTETDQERLRSLWGGKFCQVISSLSVEVPGLDQRACDIPGLASQLLAFFARKHASAPKYLLPEAVTCLLMRPWRGNLHELASVIERAVVCAEGPEVGESEIVGALKAVGSTPALSRGEGMLLRQVMEQVGKSMEAQLITGVLAQTQNNRTRAARILGIGRRTLLYKLRDLARLPGTGAGSDE